MCVRWRGIPYRHRLHTHSANPGRRHVVALLLAVAVYYGASALLASPEHDTSRRLRQSPRHLGGGVRYLLRHDWRPDHLARGDCRIRHRVSFTVALLAYRTANRDRVQAVELEYHRRRQARLEVAYVDLLTYTEEVGAWAQTILPALGGKPESPEALIEPPSVERECAVRAGTAAYASEEVRQAITAWRDSMTEVRQKVLLVQLRWRESAKHEGTKFAAEDYCDWTTPWGELEKTSRAREANARASLQSAVAHELDATSSSLVAPSAKKSS